MWKALLDVTKHQQLTTLQREFDDTTQRLSVHAPIISTPSLLNTTLALHRGDLGTGLHQFYLGQHTSDFRKVPKACVEKHHVIAGDGDTYYVMAPYGVSLTETVAMAQNTQA